MSNRGKKGGKQNTPQQAASIATPTTTSPAASSKTTTPSVIKSVVGDLGPLADLGPDGLSLSPEYNPHGDLEFAYRLNKLPQLELNPPKIGIIGAGWYGCHLAKILIEKGADVTIFERENDIFMGSSGKHQFRLHLGFHYPRAFATRMQIRSSFERFQVEYPDFYENIDTNIYAVAQQDSLLDFGTYMQIINSSQIEHQLFDGRKIGLVNVGGCITCPEKALICDAPKVFFREYLKKNLKLNTAVTKITQIHEKDTEGTIARKVVINQDQTFDWIINCSYNGSFPMPHLHTFYEVCLTLIYRDMRSVEAREGKIMALTVMDGPLPSLYPYIQDKKKFVEEPHMRLYTLTHVKFTPLKQFRNHQQAYDYMKQEETREGLVEERRPHFEAGISKFFPEFTKNFSYHSFFISMKTKVKDASANRQCIVKQEGQLIHVMSGKVNTLFEAEDRVLAMVGYLDSDDHDQYDD